MPLDRIREQMMMKTAEKGAPQPDDQAGADATFGEIRADRAQALADQAPVSKENLPQADVATLDQVLATTLSTLTNGELGGDPMDGLPDINKGLPPKVFARLLAVQKLVEQNGGQELEPYRFDAMELASSPQGVQQAAAIVYQLGQDKNALRVLTTGRTTKPKESTDGRTGRGEPAGDGAPGDSGDDGDAGYGADGY